MANFSAEELNIIKHMAQNNIKWAQWRIDHNLNDGKGNNAALVRIQKYQAIIDKVDYSSDMS